MNIPHSEEEKEEDFLEYLYMGWKSGTEIWPHQVKMHLELMDAELKRLERGLMASGYLRKRAENSGYRFPIHRSGQTSRHQHGLRPVSQGKRRACGCHGKVQGEECLLRHHNLTQFLQMTCGLEEEEAEENACRMEHVISGNVLQGVQEFLKYGETYDRVVRDVDLRYLYPEGTYSFCMSLYRMEERFPRRLAEESEWFLEMAELIVSDKESFFILHGKEIEKDCRLWYLDGEKWRMAKREQNDFRLPQSALTCTVSATSPLTECDGVLGITEGIQKPEEAQCRELNIHIW